MIQVRRTLSLSASAGRWCCITALTVLALAGTIFGGGPVQTANGQPVTWNPAQPVNFVVDNGPLRAGMGAISRDEGADFVRGILGRWEAVETSLVTLQDRGFLAEDVTVENFEDFLFQVRPEGNPIVFDADGGIVDAVIGEGASEDVLGFALAFELSDDNLLDYGVMVINGKDATLGEVGETSKTVLHEFGHLLGLDHTQVGLEFFLGNDPELVRRTVPLMFPIVVPGPANLLTDDRVWISYLYPSASFPLERGSIQGEIFRRTGRPFQGAHVLAVPVETDADDNVTLLMEDRVSVVSGFLRNPGDSSFELPGLPPGEYVVAAEPIFSIFTGGSGVGPFDSRFEDFPRDFFNPDESGDPEVDDPEEFSILTVAAGGSVTGVDLVSNELFNRLDALTDDDSVHFVFPEGFVFPFGGEIYRAVEVNSNGSLTFVEGDDSFSLSEQEFVQGLPRVAPLFTDLNPEAGGEIASQYDGDSLTFSWTEVPEFSAPGEEANSFAVSLFRNGEIRFHYDSVALTPGLGSPPIALVGVSPGGLEASPGATDLDAAQPFRLAQDAIFEIFDVDQFDLVGSEVLFQVDTVLLFPLNLADASTFTGFAVTNEADETVRLQVEARRADGFLQDYPENPHWEDLGGTRQLARLGSDFFALPATAAQDGWVRIGTDGAALASFYQFGSVADGVVTQLDGSAAFSAQASVLYFTRLYDGPASFPALEGARDAETLLAIANPNPDAITVTFQLFDGAGDPVGDPVQRELPPNGCSLEGLATLFEQEAISAGFVRAETQEAALVGFELVRLDGTLLGFNASFGNQFPLLFSAQLAHGGQTLPIFTSLKLINTSDESRALVLTALAESGEPLGHSVPLQLEPTESLQADLGELFDLGPVAGPASVGSLRVEADGAGVIGDVLFGDPNLLRFAAALPLQSRLFRRALFSQVANLSSPRPDLRTFTGLAFHNPGDEPAQVTVRVFMEDGVETGSTVIDLGPGQRLSRQLTELVPSSVGQVRGYIVLESCVPIVAQQLFGNFTLDFLSAVPPTISDVAPASCQ